ncbi:hypothetical protein DL767_003442 [Monosporascus sp. MG133]|nr:hypothetical protein DL767_003442 [Monosporascus sp. MG133]
MGSRVDAYAAAWALGDIDAALAYFVEEGLDYPDYGLMVLHMDKKALMGPLPAHRRRMRGSALRDEGHVIEFTVLEDVQHCSYKKGDRGKAFCTATIRWRDGKICRNSDYDVWGVSGVQG